MSNTHYGYGGYAPEDGEAEIITEAILSPPDSIFFLLAE